MNTSPALVVTSTILSVQVYRRGASIVRRAVLEGARLAEGVPAMIELVGLPLSLVDHTARVQVTAIEPKGVEVVAADVRVGIHVRPGLPPPPAPERKELDDVGAEIAATQELVGLLDHELSLLMALPVPERPTGEEGRPPPPAPLAMRLALEAFADDAAEVRRRQRRQLLTRLRELQRHKESLEERLRAASTATAAKTSDLSKSLIVPLRVTGTPTRIVVEVRYLVPGARWVPAWQVKLARDGSTATIQHRAHIVQASGEDWNGVTLKLSTALPTRSSQLPELSSIRIGRAQPPPKARGFRPAPKGGAQLFGDNDRDRQRLLAALPPPRPWMMPSSAPSSFSVGYGSPEAMPQADGSARGGAPARSSPPAQRSLSKRSRRAEVEFDDADNDELLEKAASYESAAMPVMAAMSMAMPPSPSPPPAPASRQSAKANGSLAAVVDDEAVVFGRLRLPDADDASRGRLVPADSRSRYAESAKRAGRPLPFDVATVVDNAVATAEQAGRTEAPALCIDVGSDDGSGEDAFDHAYDADGVVDVAADGSWHSVPLGDREAPAKMRYVAVPREELAVYRIAALENPLRAPMLAGPAEVYVGGEYVLTTSLETVPAGGELTLGLGVEQAIKIARNARFAETREGQGVVAMVELVHDLEIDVVNHLTRPIEIEVRERVPVPAPGAEVQVEERAVTPPWHAWDQLERGELVDGGRRWQIVVERGGSAALRARYVLRLFSNAEIQGGNRREA